MNKEKIKIINKINELVKLAKEANVNIKLKITEKEEIRVIEGRNDK